MFFERKFKSERRRRKRQVLNTSVEIFTQTCRIDALGINLTDVGMCLFTVADLSLGSQVDVEFLPARDSQPVRLSGIVRNRAVYLYGIEFLKDKDPRSHVTQT